VLEPFHVSGFVVGSLGSGSLGSGSLGSGSLGSGSLGSGFVSGSGLGSGFVSGSGICDSSSVGDVVGHIGDSSSVGDVVGFSVVSSSVRVSVSVGFSFFFHQPTVIPIAKSSLSTLTALLQSPLFNNSCHCE
jgi:hypothetical protein